MSVKERMKNCGIVPIAVLDRAEDAVPCGKALLAGGIDIMEITLRTTAAINAIGKVSKELPDICLGAGTVMTLDRCRLAVGAGAKFIVSPGFNRDIVEWCMKNDVVVVPGCVTPTEIMYALEYKINLVKFFPASMYGGLAGMKALTGPFPNISFIPTGGISSKNLAEYITAPFVHAVGGSWICTAQDISKGEFDKITAISSQSTDIVKKVREMISKK